MPFSRDRLSRGAIAIACCIFATASYALVEPASDGVRSKQMRSAALDYERPLAAVSDLQAQAAATAEFDLNSLQAPESTAKIDRSSGGFATLTPSTPLIPGAANTLSWAQLGLSSPQAPEQRTQHIAQVFSEYLSANAASLRIDQSELGPMRITLASDHLVQIYVPQVHQGIAVRNSYLTAVINRGNLILLGTQHWRTVSSLAADTVSLSAAQSRAATFLAPHTIAGFWGKPEPVVLPVAGNQPGDVIQHRKAWVLKPRFADDMGHWEMLVDVHSGDILSFQDSNHYVVSPRSAAGGVYPVSNDGIAPDGIEQAGWPMPFMSVVTPSGTVTTDSGGNLPVPVDGTITGSFTGPYVHVSDDCGAASLGSTTDIDFGTSGGDDCTTPGFGGAGNTHSARTNFYELNRIIEIARGHLPSNTWLQQQLTTNLNINNSCNAFWGGASVNFYRSGGGCANTGEIAAVVSHEWGHGIDDNDAVPTIASPSGEGIADIYAAIRLNESCIGRGFFGSNCTGFGDACTACTGVRDIDYAKRVSGAPHTYTWSNANCGSSVHCIGAVYAEAVWSLWKHKLTAAPYSYDDATAQEIVSRLTYIGGGNTGTWFSGGPPFGGCAGTSGYMNYLAADDDDGDLNNGTPHMTAIYEAFNDQEIACATPTVQDAGCAGAPSTAPVVTTTVGHRAVSLSWGAVSGASSYKVYRTDGIAACGGGKVPLGETSDTTWYDVGLQNGRDYHYFVIPKGSSDACTGPASACTTVQSVLGPDIAVDENSLSPVDQTGDFDDYVDNCEIKRLDFNVFNGGGGTLVNPRITAASTDSHPTTIIKTMLPAAITPSTLAAGESGTGFIKLVPQGLVQGDTFELTIEVTADGLLAPQTVTFSLANAEVDAQNVASETFTFEAGEQSWMLNSGTFARTNSAGAGANASDWYMQSSAFLDNQCDRYRSEPLILHPDSTLSMYTNFDIEPASGGQWYDRANVGLVATDQTRTLIQPNTGRTYNTDSGGSASFSGCIAPLQGWADTASTWASSEWDAAALQAPTFAGQAVQLEVAYATDVSVTGDGIRFDHVTLTNFDRLIADGQPDGSCTVPVELQNYSIE